MVDTRILMRSVLDKIEDSEEFYKENINNDNRGSRSIKYIEKYSNNISDVDSLVNYYNSLSKASDKAAFKNLVKFIFNNEIDDVSSFYTELNNMTLLKNSPIFEFVNDKEKIDNRSISNFLLRFNRYKEESNEIDNNSNNKKNLKLIRKYKNYFSPIGVTKEVDNIVEFKRFLDLINVSNYETTSILFSTLSNNKLIHDNIIYDYELDVNKVNSDLFNRKFIFDKDLFNKLTVRDIESGIFKTDFKVLSDLYNIDILTTVEEEPISVEIEGSIEEVIEEKIDNEIENDLDKELVEEEIISEEDITDSIDRLVDKQLSSEELFDLNYNLYKNNSDISSMDYFDVIDKAKKYYDKNYKDFSKLSDIALEDLNDTLNVYKENSDLREIVYNTTENVKDLLVYEIKDIFESYDISDSENLINISRELTPVVTYIESITDTKKNRKK